MRHGGSQQAACVGPCVLVRPPVQYAVDDVVQKSCCTTRTTCGEACFALVWVLGLELEDHVTGLTASRCGTCCRGRPCIFASHLLQRIFNPRVLS